MGKESKLVCSWCEKGQDEVGHLIAGPGVAICDECLACLTEIMAKEDPAWLKRVTKSLENSN
jgi:ATP-dependent Clp protease ATP-binding subunit ClpX